MFLKLTLWGYGLQSPHNLYGEYLMKEALAEVVVYEIGVRIINKVRFGDDTANGYYS